ncbi:MAG: histidine kinase [Alphaproteobacteria bacterium]|nr:histidine kinase [Alphaproteobacteria bacterium]
MEHVNDIDDRWPRVVGILGFGLGIPQLTGLFGPLGPSDPRYAAGLVWFVVLASVIWHGNRWLLFRQRERLDWFTSPVAKVVFLVVGCVFYTAPVTAAMLWAWYAWAAFGPVDTGAIGTVVLANVICVLFVAHIYETAFLVKARRDDRLVVAELERARAEGELAALRSQIDPHFLFNSLNTLQWLIERDPPAASLYTAKLAQVYRYILANRERELVQLPDELAFFDDCFHLLEVRFGHALRVERSGLDAALDRYLVPPISLQLLLENAVKHNAFSERDPLSIAVTLEDGHIEVANPIRVREADGEGLGLANLAERVRLSMARELEVRSDQGWFRVRVPVAVVA